jgi:hypothetical protein
LNSNSIAIPVMAAQKRVFALDVPAIHVLMQELAELGIRQLNTLLTPAKIWQAIQDAKARV